MDLSEYQRRAQETAVYQQSVLAALQERSLPEWERFLNVQYAADKVAGEAGEIVEHIGKALRDDFAIITDDRKEKLTFEIGDLLWELSALCTELGLDMDIVAFMNLKKLRDRQTRGVLHGSGDER